MKTFIGSEYDPVTGMETRYFHNAADGKIHVQRLQDVEDTLNANQAEYNAHGDHARFKEGAMHKMASIPMSVYEKWKQEGFDVFTASDADLRRRLNSSEFKKLRTMPGKM